VLKTGLCAMMPIWLTPDTFAETGHPAAGLDVVDPLLDATERLMVGTSIVNAWGRVPRLRAGYVTS
jgi:hypothetical protein